MARKGFDGKNTYISLRKMKVFLEQMVVKKICDNIGLY